MMNIIHTRMGAEPSKIVTSKPSPKSLPPAKQSAMNPPPTRYRAIYPKHHQCTHHVMTRLYTTEFKCTICMQVGAFGWLYRCAQDRELLLDDDWGRGFQDKIDPISDLYERSTTRLRSPESRASKLAFLHEINNEQLKTYTPEQLKRILEQRSHILDVAKADTRKEYSVFLEQQTFQTPRRGKNDVYPFNEEKPWIPFPEGECQFKVCPRCRPTFRERSFLNLDAIVNGDVPAAAAAGFGFNLMGARPVAPTDIMKQIGLRPSPEPRLEDPDVNYTTAPKTPVPHPASGDLGLGIFAGQAQTPSPFSFAPLSSVSPSKNPECSTSIPMIPQGDSPICIRRAIPLLSRAKSPRLKHYATSASLRQAAGTPLPNQTDDEIELTSEESRRPLTPMEQHELKGGRFGSLPLEVGGGVAVLEESVELHSADVITQY